MPFLMQITQYKRKEDEKMQQIYYKTVAVLSIGANFRLAGHADHALTAL
jgi:hypothetical protein